MTLFKKKHLRPVLLALGNFALLNMGVPGHALAADSATPQASSQIDEVIVTARRRKESIQQTPIAMTAISGKQLEAAAAVKITDLQGMAPNVLITTQSTGAATANISIRGLSYADVEKITDPAVAVVVDGVFIGTSTGQLLDFFDIESIEVLRGPQGTLFGRNTIGGVINIRRSRPTGEFGGKFEVGYGKFNTFTARSVLNVPIIKDKLAAKAFYFHSATKGYYNEYLTGQHTGGSRNENYGASFLLTPDENFSALLTLEQQESHFIPVNAELSKTGEVFCFPGFLPAGACNRNGTSDLYTAYTPIGTTSAHYRAPGATLEMKLQAGSVDLTSVTGYREQKEGQIGDYGTTGLYLADREQSYYQFSQELRAAGKLTDTFDYVIGGYYFKNKVNLHQHTRLFFSDNLFPDQTSTGKSESYAGFGDFNWQFIDQWRLSFGGRFTHDKKEYETTAGGVPLPNGVASWNKFTPKVSIDYRPSNDLMLYGSWSRGYRSGGFSPRAGDAVYATRPFNPESVDSFEVGVKSAWLDRRLLLNVDAFYTKYKNIQESTTIPVSGGGGNNQTIIFNAASAKVKGIELDFTAKPVSNLTLHGSVGILDTKFGSGFLTTEGTNTFDYSAVNMIYAPKLTASASAEYLLETEPGDVRFNVSYRHLSPYDQQIGRDPTLAPTGPVTVVPQNDPRVRSDTQNLVDASISFMPKIADNKLRLTVYGRNLLDDRGADTAFTVAGLWSFAAAREPRTYGGQIGYEF